MQHIFLEEDPEAKDVPRAQEEGVGEHLVPETSLDLQLQILNPVSLILDCHHRCIYRIVRVLYFNQSRLSS